MKNRLEVARDLLSEDGVIAVHCDYTEDSYFNQAVFIAVKIYLIANTILGVFFSTGDDFFI
jgi:hypothetical protein